MFSSKVRMMYFGHRMALLRVWEGSPYFSPFGGGWFSLSVEKPLSAGQWFHTHPGPLWSHPAMKWARSDWGHGWVWSGSGSRSRSTGGPRKPRPWKSEVQFLEMNSRVQVPSVGQTRMDVSGVVEEVQLLIPDGCQVQSAVAGEGYLWNVSLWSPHVELAHQVLCLPLNWIRLVGQF